MEQEKTVFFNSPVIHKNTPIKRLGLSRKRKSCSSGFSLNKKIQACGEKLLESPTHSEVTLSTKQVQSVADIEDEGNESSINYDEKIKALKQKIAEDEEKLKALKCNENNISQLESLIELWKNGCKNAFLHFSQLLKDKQSENIDFKAVLSKLGIWETMLQNFESDSEVSLSDNSQ